MPNSLFREAGMNRWRQFIGVSLLGLGFSLATQAMDDTDELKNYVQLSNLQEIILHSPSELKQRSSELQSWYVIAWAYLEQSNIAPAASVVSEGERKFKHYASPVKLAEFINDRFPARYYRANAVSTDKLEAEQLLEIVKINLINNTPLLVYNYDYNYLLIGMIVGYHQQKENMLLVLSQDQEGNTGIKTVNIETMIKIMDLSSVIKRFNNFNLSGKLREIYYEFIGNINRFNMVNFTRSNI